MKQACPYQVSSQTITDLCIVIVNYNGQRLLERLLPSIRENYLKTTHFSIEVMVVDNGSADHSVAYLKKQSWVRLIESPVNGGFAYGNNLALNKINSRYVLLLNSDTEIPAVNGKLDQLIDYLDEHERVAVITPHVLLGDGQTDMACHRGEPTPWAALTYLLGFERLFPHSRCLAQYHQGWKNRQEIHTIDACTGAAMMVRQLAIEQVGLLDERFFMYAEDIDWCRRFREAGYTVVFYPGVTVIHHKFKSGIDGNDTIIRSASRNWFYDTMLQYYDKYHGKHHPSFFRSILRLYIRIKCREPIGK